MSLWKNKTFKYKIADTDILRPIQVDVNKCQSIKDLKKKIAIELHIYDYKLHFINPPTETQLKKIREYFTFSLMVDGCCKNIDFIFPKGKIIQITNCYKMNYYQIVKSFQKKGLYYSEECIKKYFHFKIAGKELPHIEYPVLGIPYEHNLVNVEFGCVIVILKYGNKKFLFAENELSLEAYNILNEVYKGCSDISIQNSNKRKVKTTDKLKKYIHYFIRVDFRVSFKNIKTDSECILYLDSLSRVHDAKKNIAVIYSSNRQLLVESIIIYDGNKEIIEDPRKKLQSIQELNQCFYFDFDEKMKFLNQATSNRSNSSLIQSNRNFDRNNQRYLEKQHNKKIDPLFYHKQSFKGEFINSPPTQYSQSNESSIINDYNQVNDDEEEEQQSFSFDQENFEEEEDISDDENAQSIKMKYYYQTCKEDKVEEVELTPDATVLTLKKVIAEKNDVDNLSNVKIIFNGYELLDDDLLKSLKIGDSKIFVYIRSKEDIQIMKANELHFTNDLTAILDEDDNDDDDEI
ncbi:hypothetical protein M9Y10_010571 [Tritrichomonas musculus]|uniref:Ubiquitin-like domain-containing protein n=1 Tax=Tritrichomonas musculus TaxID=1915356 RepID=A0ABR2IL42_9EUKA